MLIRITKQEAFEMLLDKNKQNKIYFKYGKSYEKAIDYKWIFGSETNSGVLFERTDFYKEVDE